MEDLLLFCCIVRSPDLDLASGLVVRISHCCSYAANNNYSRGQGYAFHKGRHGSTRTRKRINGTRIIQFIERTTEVMTFCRHDCFRCLSLAVIVAQHEGSVQSSKVDVLDVHAQMSTAYDSATESNSCNQSSASVAITLVSENYSLHVFSETPALTVATVLSMRFSYGTHITCQDDPVWPLYCQIHHR